MWGWLRKYRERVAAEADEFMESFGDNAYVEARKEMRKAREHRDRRGEKFYCRVAIRIAKRMDIEVGLDAATRYIEKQTPYDAGPGFVRKPGGTLH